MKQLSDLHVTRVDLVDRAAVRDPDDPTQPMRFLVWKKETAPTNVPATKQAVTPVTKNDPTPLEVAGAKLREHLAKRDSQPVVKSRAQRETEDLAKAEMQRDDSITYEQAIVHVRERRPDLVRAYRDEQIAAGQPVAKRDQQREAASSRLDSRIKTAMRERGVDEPTATDIVLKSAEGDRDYRIAKGEGPREKPRLPVTKSSTYFQQLLDVASVIQKANPKLTNEQALVRASEMAPDVRRAYDEAMRQEFAS